MLEGSTDRVGGAVADVPTAAPVAASRAFSRREAERAPLQAAAPPRAGFHVERSSLGVLIVGLAVTVALALSAHALYAHNEQRLLNLRVREAAGVLGGALPVVQTPLASAAELAAATHGDVARFRRFMAGYVGPGRAFVSASLWSVPLRAPRPLAVVGVTPDLAALPAQAAALLSSASRAPVLAVTGMLGQSSPRLGYAFAAAGPGRRFVAYAESALPRDRLARPRPGAAFSDLNYALYLGRSTRGPLLESSVRRVPLPGRQAAAVVPFGSASFDLVMTPITPLSGSFFRWLAWILAAGGVVLTLAATRVADRLSLRRRVAEQLAGRLERAAHENRRLYAEQRDIALTLQHALLPETLPAVTGLEAAVRYVPGVATLEIGGDWYDLIRVDEQLTLFVIGDVSGRGLRAASVMASLRHAVRAYAVDTSSPTEILDKLAKLLDVERDGHFATVLCGLIDREAGQLTIASAGHPPPLLIDADGARFLTSTSGTPIGVHPHAPAISLSTPVGPGATVLAYTDGMIERRGEHLDVGLERLRVSAEAPVSGLDALIARLVGELDTGGPDDVALIGIRWLE